MNIIVMRKFFIVLLAAPPPTRSNHLAPTHHTSYRDVARDRRTSDTTDDTTIGKRTSHHAFFSRSAFSNLIFNAVKYTPAGGLITIIWKTDRDGGHLSVKDTGIGIDPVHIPRLTERFYRADPSRHKETGGTGLGLAIVKHVLLNHDGNLEIRSRIGDGSEFICHFPRERLAERLPETAS